MTFGREVERGKSMGEPYHPELPACRTFSSTMAAKIALRVQHTYPNAEIVNTTARAVSFEIRSLLLI